MPPETKDLTGLPPIAGPGARVLILGSMPGARSLEAGQYYANPGNRFWRVTGQLLGFDPRAPYAVRVDALTGRGVALWDVLARCRRRGSLDGAIEKGSEQPNDLASFLTDHPEVVAIGLNGGAAARAFRASVLPDLAAPCRVLDLPSTSGANAACRYEQLLEQWARVLSYVRQARDSPQPVMNR